jgi:hypothetical protein
VIVWQIQGVCIDMQIRSVGIDLGKTTFHFVVLSEAGKVLVAEEVHPEAAGYVYRQHVY